MHPTRRDMEMNDLKPANDNPLKPRDWYTTQAILMMQDAPPQIVAIAFYLGHSKVWLRNLPPRHADVVARRKVGRRFARIA
jgi:hypothetical protein